MGGGSGAGCPKSKVKVTPNGPFCVNMCFFYPFVQVCWQSRKKKTIHGTFFCVPKAAFRRQPSAFVFGGVQFLEIQKGPTWGEGYMRGVHGNMIGALIVHVLSIGPGSKDHYLVAFSIDFAMLQVQPYGRK